MLALGGAGEIHQRRWFKTGCETLIVRHPQNESAP
jgi:hypothetical protein